MPWNRAVQGRASELGRGSEQGFGSAGDQASAGISTAQFSGETPIRR